MFIGTEYLKEITEPTTLMVTNVDWDLYNDHYDIEVLAYGGGWRFRAREGMFNGYIDKWMEVKAKETGGKREIAKLHLNSLYGKFASNPNVTSKIPVLEDGKVRLLRGDAETRDPVYTAAGVFITAWARDITIRAAQANYGSFAYADTDSLHLLQDSIPASINVHPTELGAWKHEYNFVNAFYIRPKAYMEQKSLTNTHKVACINGCNIMHKHVKIEDECKENCEINHHFENRIAGLPVTVSEKLSFNDLVEGNVIKGKLQPKTVPGGVVLTEVGYKLKLS
jgi:hypothetical protein